MSLIFQLCLYGIVFGSKTQKVTEVPEPDQKDIMIAELVKENAQLKDDADALDSIAIQQGRALVSIEKYGKDESDERLVLYQRADDIENNSKNRNRTLDTRMTTEYARKQKSVPSKKKKTENDKETGD